MIRILVYVFGGGVLFTASLAWAVAHGQSLVDRERFLDDLGQE